LHEIVEWLDEVTAAKLSIKPSSSLNKNFVANQKMLHSAQFEDAAPLLYMTRPMIPNWKYYDELVASYSSVHHVTNPSEYEVTSSGIVANGTQYSAISRKYSWRIGAKLEQLNADGLISILQPLWMRRFGHKDYLQEFESPAILQSDTLNPADINTYIANKEELVLKIVDAGGSKSVYLGPMCSDEKWRHYLLVASSNAAKWIVQQYVAPHKHDVAVHGKGLSNVPIQLGIFVLPNPTNPHDYSLDIVVKAYGGQQEYFTFDPSGLNPDIWFGNVIEHAQP